MTGRPARGVANRVMREVGPISPDAPAFPHAATALGPLKAAAEKLGKSGDDAEAYAKEVVSADFEEAGDHDVLRKIKADLDAAGVAQSEHQIRRTMDELMAQAIEQVKS